MRRTIKASDDAIKSRVRKITSDENDLLMDSMRDTVDTQDDPKVGMFWYNPTNNVLVGVRSAFAGDLNFNHKGRKTVRDLHHKIWDSVRDNAIANGSTGEIWSEEDCTQVPRGRIFQIQVPNSDIEYFEILVGSWIDTYPQAMQLIVDEFNLRDAEYEFIHSEHWDIGRGTSELFV